MGAFVLGVLIGWLAEWMFYTFWVKEGENSSDCSSLKAELEAKNRQIDSLRSQLEASTETSTNKPAQAVKSEKADVAKSSSKKASVAKKPATKKPTKSPAASKSVSKQDKLGGDDFTKLSGIGPSMSATLKSLGIDTFTKLAETDDDILRVMLVESGARMNNNIEVMDSWNEQALAAAKGDFAALKKMQEELKK